MNLNPDAIKILKELMQIDSTSGKEKDVGQFIANYLKIQGFEVIKQAVSDDTFNVFALVGKPEILLEAHMDTVAPYIPYDEDENNIYGRGACDTKGSAAAMIEAAINAKNIGVSDFGLLFTVGEETDFAGAEVAKNIVKKYDVFVIVGEPTNLQPVNAHFGMLRFDIEFTGKAAHSSEPQKGTNAIDLLIRNINEDFAKISIHKDTLMSYVKITGGTADNIIPDKASVTLSFRISPEDRNDYVAIFSKAAANKCNVTKIMSLPAANCKIPDKFAFLGTGQSVKYCTELGFFGNGLILGPGSIKNAHGEGEFIRKKDVEKAVTIYEKILCTLK